MPNKIHKNKALPVVANQNEETKTEVIDAEPKESETAITMEPKNIKLGKNGSIIIGTLNVFITPARKRYHKFYHPKESPHWSWHILIDTIMAIAIISLIVLNVVLIFNPGLGIERKIDLKISIQPTEVTSGDTATYYIDYHNGSKHRLKNAKVSVKLPPTFILEKTTPEKMFLTHSNTFELGDIEAGGNGQITLQGQLLGNVGESQKVGANINFTAQSYNLYQQKQAELKYLIGKSAVDLAIEAPAKVSNGQNFTMNIKYKNNSSYDLSQIIIENNLSALGYNLKSKLPFDNDAQWRITEIKAHSEGTIALEGNFTMASSTSSTEMKLQSFISASGQKLLQNNISKKIEIVHSNFILQLIPDSENLNPGDTADYTIKYQNQEKFDLINPKLQVKCEGDFIDNNSMTINTPKTITAGKTGEIKFSAKLKSKIAPTRIEQKNYSISCWAEGNYQMSNDHNLELYSASAKTTQKINTDLTLSAFSRYFSPEEDQLGFGPLPPVVDKQTRYWIFISAESTYNDVADIVITATIADNAKFTGKTSVTSGDNISYDSENKIISWKAQEVLAPSTFYPIIGCAFELELTPQTDQIGKYAPLLQDIKISGTDKFTGKKITTSVNNITSNLEFDKTNTKSGKVIK